MRGQAYTLEALIGALLLVSALTFALQVTAVTPLSASTSNQHIENQQRASASGALTAAQEAAVLKDAVLFWDEDGGAEYHGAERVTYYTNNHPPNEFGAILNRSFGGRGLAVNVLIYPGNDQRPLRMIYRGEPSDNAVSASRMVTIYDDDHLTEPDGNGGVTESNTEVQNANQFKRRIPHRSSSSDIHAVVRVEVTVWRM